MTAASPSTETPSLAAPGTSPAPSGNGAQPPATSEPSWRDAIPEPLRADPHLSKFKDVGELAKEHVNLQGLIGRKGVILPGKDAKPEEVAAFHKAIGVPESPEKYDLGDWKAPEGLPWNEGLVPKMLGHFHAAGIPNEAARKVIESYANEQNAAFQEVMAASQRSLEEGFTALKKDYGQAYDQRIDAGQKAFTRFAGKNLDKLANLRFADGTAFHEHPEMIRLFSEIGVGMGEHALIGDAQRGIAMTPDMAKSQITKNNGDPEFQKKLNTRDHVEHSAAVEEMKRLFAAAYPE